MNRERFTETVISFAQLDDKSKIIFPVVNGFTIVSIIRGILFIFAGWSGPSVHSWKTLTGILKSEGNIDFYVLDADELPTGFIDRELKAIPQGNGETYWIRNGNILHALTKYENGAANEIKAFTKEVATD